MNYPAQNAKSPAATELSQDKTTTDSAILTDPESDRNTFNALKAQLAEHEFGFYELACGGFLVARWDRCSYLSDLGAVRRFVSRALWVNHG